MTATRSTYQHNPVSFFDDFIPKNEKGQSWALSPYQRKVLKLAFRWNTVGALLLRIFLWGEMKKSGKTLLLGGNGLWWGFVTPNTEIVVASNSLDQSTGRVFRTMVNLLKYNPVLGQCATVKANEIILTNGTIITAIPSEYKAAAGSRHSLVIYDELWGYSLESAERLFEELTPPPTEPNAWVLIGTTAGFTNESVVLENLYKRGLAGERIDEELELYVSNELTMFWSEQPRQPWQTQEYYDQQRRILRPTTFARLHENRWVTAESTFITPELWDTCTDPTLIPLLPTKEKELYVGVDAGIKHDTAAVVAVYREDNYLKLASHRIWKPSPDEPLNLEETIEAHLRELYEQFDLVTILCDPYQLHRSIMTLKSAGIPIREFPQTSANTTRMGQAIFDLLNGKNLVVYPSDDLRGQALNTVAIESSRGWRVAKEKASKKIDAIVAMSMACVAALDNPASDSTPLDIFVPGQGWLSEYAGEPSEGNGDDSVIVNQIREEKVYFPDDNSSWQCSWMEK